MKKLYQVLVAIDDFADTPQLHKPHGALDQFLCCWRLRNQHELDAVIEELSALLPKEQLYQLCEQATREPYSFLFVYYLKSKKEMFHIRFEERFVIENADGSALSFLGQKLFASSTLISARFENISCCTSVAAVQPPVVRRTGGFLKKRMTTIYVDSFLPTNLT